MIATLAVVPVHAANPAFVTWGDNATCGAHCILTTAGSQTFGFGFTSQCSSGVCDQWGTWGLSAALVVTSGDLLVAEFTNFCIFDNNGAGSANRCDITAFSDSLGNVFTCTTIGNNLLMPLSTTPVIGASVCYDLATVSGTEAATNAFKLTVNCGTCDPALDANHQFDTEYLIYEYSNAQSVLTGNYVTTAVSVTTLNAPITTTVSGDTIMGFSYDGNGRPLIYQSSQTNQHTWAGSTGYFIGDLEGLTIGTTNYKMGVTTSDQTFQIVTAEISNSLPVSTTPPTPTPGSSVGVGPNYSWIAWISIPGIFLLAVVAVALKRK